MASGFTLFHLFARHFWVCLASSYFGFSLPQITIKKTPHKNEIEGLPNGNHSTSSL